MSSKVHRTSAYAMAGCLLCVTSAVAHAQDQMFVWRGTTITVPLACFEGEPSFIVITAENVALCSSLSPDTTDAFNFALADEEPVNDPVALIQADLNNIP